MSVGIPERRDRVEGLGEGWRRILKWITKKWDRGMCTGFMWLRVEVRGGCCEHGIELSGSTKGCM